MPIANVPTLYQKIASGGEGGHEFARIIKLLLNADCDVNGITLFAESDASGDYKKLDAYYGTDEYLPALITGFQFKFYPAKFSSSQKQEIVRSIDAALAENDLIQEFILVTPEDFMKEEQAWFAGLKQKYDQQYWLKSSDGSRKASFELIHWGHTKIIEMMLKHDHIGIHCYPELYPAGTGKFKLNSATIDCSISQWQVFDKRRFGYWQGYGMGTGNMTTDPVFDFRFTNNSSEIFLLQQIDIHILKVSTQLKGIPQQYFLQSIGTIEHEMDFTKPINSIYFNDPMIFKANAPMRFHLQLKHFTSRCPGNCAEIKCWFHFANYSVPTETFYLSF